MASSIARSPTVAYARNQRRTGKQKKHIRHHSRARRPYVPGVREPYHLPDQKAALPPPEPAPGQLPNFNWLTSLLPPVIIVGAMVTVQMLSPTPNWTLVFGSMAMSLGFPLANIIGLFSQRRNHKKAMLKRQENYRHRLEQERSRLASLAQQQRSVLEVEYPRASQVMDIALAAGAKPRLWYRRPQDTDFLWLRIGKGKGKPSFSVGLPNFNDPFDPLAALPEALAREFDEVPDLPFMVDLKRVGSLAVISSDAGTAYNAIRRLLLDLLVHHSPKDLQVAVLSDIEEAAARWSWLKWAPHTAALDNPVGPRRVALRGGTITDAIEWLFGEYRSRRDERSHFAQSETDAASIVCIVDDRGQVRQTRELATLAERGHEQKIYLVFLGERNLPRIRARLDVSDQGAFRYSETWEGGVSQRGSAEGVDAAEIESVARCLARLEAMGDKPSYALPETLSMAQMLEANPLNAELLRRNWETPRSERELLQFPFGVRSTRDGLEPVAINLLPAEIEGGEGAYHTILIGTTGSGKSEIMKAMVLGAIHKYSPRQLNFFFMDFKGGSTFDPFKDLPHVTGIVTNLNPGLVERGLDALESEINRRQARFVEVAKKNIWDYNQMRSAQPMPHLVLFLDEFTRGLKEFDRLPGILDTLVRLGRSLGMYLVLGNQDVNAAVDNLLTNVGWRIALMVARSEEMSIIDKNLPPARRAGHGYLRSLLGDIYEFQAGYAGKPLLALSAKSTAEISIYEVEADGQRKLKPIARQASASAGDASEEQKLAEKQKLPTEQDVWIECARQAALEAGLETARPIYLDPLPTEISLASVLDEALLYRRFSERQWSGVKNADSHLMAPLGCLDFPKECVQRPMLVNFNEMDGHLWLVGKPNSGKSMTLTSLLLSLAITHTPEEVNFYILECGAGIPGYIENLPHTGAFIHTDETERFQRLLNYLDGLMDERTKRKSGRAESEDFETNMAAPLSSRTCSQAEIFLAINNFAELRKAYPDEAMRISRYAQDGKAAGVHLIIATNQGLSDLPGRISNNIARKILLNVGQDEYMEIAHKMMHPPALYAPGRGHWVGAEIAECQIARPLLLAAPGGAAVNIARDLVAPMRESWLGCRPQPIETLPACISLEELRERQTRAGGAAAPAAIPLGIAYDTLEAVSPDLVEEMHQWLVIGPVQSGKSNLLACMARSALAAGGWDVRIFCLRRSPPVLQLAAQENLAIFNTPESIIAECQALAGRLSQPDSGQRRLLLLVDDLSVAFEPGREPMKSALDTLAPLLADHPNTWLAAASTMEGLRNGMVTRMLQLLRSTNTGLAFSIDTSVLDWLGVPSQFLMGYRKFDLPPGRGFFVSKRKYSFLQTPRLEKCPPGNAR